MLHLNANGILTDTKGFHNSFELICCNNKASLVNMLVTFCSKLECSFLTTTLFLYLHFSTTAKVPPPKMLRTMKVIINKFYGQRI